VKRNMKYSTVGKVFYYCLLLVVFSLVFSSCKTEKDTYTFDYQYDYAPIDSGHYVIYDVDSISYAYIDPVPIRDSARYQLKEEIGAVYYDNLNEVNLELNLYKRKDANSPWVFDRKWTVKRTTTNFQKREVDLQFVKLVFPPQLGKEWNGNIYIDNNPDFLDWNYHYTSVNEPFSINGLSFDSTLTVSEVNDTLNLVERKIRKEIYAKGVGMIYQEWEILDKQNILGNWQTGDLNGFRIRMRIAEHN
jgi:hypothetical protein